MNVKQIEEKSGMTRANIRYYEQEGLLSPVRQENGYRDYSEADLVTLQKVRLLRELGLPIETIRRLQAGEESLSDVLAARIDQLQDGAAAVQVACKVCAALRSDGVNYDTMDAQKYWEQAVRLTEAVPVPSKTVAPPTAVQHAPQVRGYTPQPLPEGWKQVAPMPWRRYAARTLDLALYSLAVDLVLFGWLRFFPPQNELIQWLQGVLCLLVMIVVEPLLLVCFGTTPGKWLLGIRLVWRGGRKFFYSDGLVRTAKVVVQGFGLNIPVLKLFCLWRAWRNELHGTYHPWEDPCEWYLVREQDRPALRLTLCTAATAVTVFCAILATLQGFLPSAYTAGKGVTLQQFVTNYNAYSSYFECGDRLNPDGSWVPPPYETYYSVELPDGTMQEYKEQPLAPLEFEIDADGMIVRVSHTWQSQPYQAVIGSPALQLHLCLFSFAAAQPGVTGWQLAIRDGFYNNDIGSGVYSVQFTTGRVRVQYTVTTQGYLAHNESGLLWRESDTVDPDAYVRVEFTMEKLTG